MTDRFNQFFKLLMHLEGGYSDVVEDRGGRSKYGITEFTLKQYDPLLHIEDLDLATAKKIYKERYYDKVYPARDTKVHYHYFDICVNSGYGNYIKCRRQSKGTSEGILVWRRNFYYGIVQKDATQQVFYRGWMNRLTDIERFKFE